MSPPFSQASELRLHSLPSSVLLKLEGRISRYFPNSISHESIPTIHILLFVLVYHILLILFLMITMETTKAFSECNVLNEKCLLRAYLFEHLVLVGAPAWGGLNSRALLDKVHYLGQAFECSLSPFPVFSLLNICDWRCDPLTSSSFQLSCLLLPCLLLWWILIPLKP